MAASTTAVPERWLQGLDHVIASAVDALPSVRTRAAGVPDRWVMERGPVRAAAPVDALGGFPGGLRSSQRLLDASLIVTDRYLVIGEGTSTGFALPIEQIVGAGLDRPSRQANTGLVIEYQDGPGIGAFALNFRGLPRGLSGRRRVDEVLRHLETAGVSSVDPVEGCTAPLLSVSWDAAAAHSGETLRWSGMVTGAVGGWHGAEQRPCRMWLTDASLFWASVEGTCASRLALDAIEDVRDGFGERVRVATRDLCGRRFDLPFDFANRMSGGGGRDLRYRFLNILAAHGIIVGSEAPPLAPWRRGGTVRPTDRGR